MCQGSYAESDHDCKCRTYDSTTAVAWHNAPLAGCTLKSAFQEHFGKVTDHTVWVEQGEADMKLEHGVVEALIEALKSTEGQESSGNPPVYTHAAAMAAIRREDPGPNPPTTPSPTRAPPAPPGPHLPGTHLPRPVVSPVTERARSRPDNQSGQAVSEQYSAPEPRAQSFDSGAPQQNLPGYPHTPQGQPQYGQHHHVQGQFMQQQGPYVPQQVPPNAAYNYNEVRPRGKAGCRSKLSHQQRFSTGILFFLKFFLNFSVGELSIQQVSVQLPDCSPGSISAGATNSTSSE